MKVITEVYNFMRITKLSSTWNKKKFKPIACIYTEKGKLRQSLLSLQIMHCTSKSTHRTTKSKRGSRKTENAIINLISFVVAVNLRLRKTSIADEVRENIAQEY